MNFDYFRPNPKPAKTEKKRRKPIPHRSKKNKPIDKESKAHLLLVKSMPCIACGSRSFVEAHHIVESYKRLGKREGKEHYYTIPLCNFHHEGEVLSIGNDKADFIEMFGTEMSLLEKFWKLIRFDRRKLD